MVNKRPVLTVIIPVHEVEGGAEFLWRNINALAEQTFQDFEIIVCKQGKMAENTNYGIKNAHGDLIKILYLDDYLSHPNSLKEQVEAFNGQWLICGANDNEIPYYTDDIEIGNNKLGSPSALMIKNENPLLFDEEMSWLLDCDYYKRMYEKYGEPEILDGNHVTIGKGEHQMTQTMTPEQKLSEETYLKEKHETN